MGIRRVAFSRGSAVAGPCALGKVGKVWIMLGNFDGGEGGFFPRDPTVLECRGCGDQIGIFFGGALKN